MPESAPERIALSPDVVSSELDGETILLDIRGERYFKLDPVGTRIWQLLGAHGEREPAIAAILDQYNIDEATVRRDLDALILRLTKLGLITAVTEP
jgi:hypothetical protein